MNAIYRRTKKGSERERKANHNSVLLYCPCEAYLRVEPPQLSFLGQHSNRLIRVASRIGTTISDYPADRLLSLRNYAAKR